MKTFNQILCAAVYLLMAVGVMLDGLDGVQSVGIGTGIGGGIIHDADLVYMRPGDRVGKKSKKGARPPCFCKDPNCPCQGGLYGQ